MACLVEPTGILAGWCVERSEHSRPLDHEQSKVDFLCKDFSIPLIVLACDEMKGTYSSGKSLM
jgi:hypothetical protein